MAGDPQGIDESDGAGLRLISSVADVESEGSNLEGMPIGNSDFRDLREQDLYFVDKSMLIDELLRSNAKVTLITRPRRFGKSLNLSMLDSYFSIRYAGGPDYFEDLRIAKARPNDPEKNSNIVIKVSLKDLGNGTYSSFLEGFRIIVSDICCHFPELRDSTRIEAVFHEIFMKLYWMKSTEAELSRSIWYLCRMLEMHHGRKAIVLIDEYDNAMNNSYGVPEEHAQIVGFMRALLGSILKDNNSLRFAVITGVMRISKESIFSGLNNLAINDVFSDRFDEMYGFTQTEVENLLADCGYPDRIVEAKEWYDGYRFGSQDVYNPWSIINYVQAGCKPDTYWANTSGNSIISDLFRTADPERWGEIEVLCSRRPIAAYVRSDVAFCDMEYSDDAIYSVMVASGYLNAVPDGDCEGGYLLSIPNKEVFKIFTGPFLGRIGSSTNKTLNDLLSAMTSGDESGVRTSLSNLMEMLSIRILKNEYPYEAFITGLTAILSGRFEILADHESGNGYYDIRMRRISGPGPNILMEIKRRKKGSSGISMDDLALSALKQIRERNYASGLKGETILYGIAFDGKVPYVAMERRMPSGNPAD